jgi:hypothetical protein
LAAVASGVTGAGMRLVEVVGAVAVEEIRYSVGCAVVTVV